MPSCEAEAGSQNSVSVSNLPLLVLQQDHNSVFSYCADKDDLLPECYYIQQRDDINVVPLPKFVHIHSASYELYKLPR